jgi:thiamine biosynthesis lipoprotein
MKHSFKALGTTWWIEILDEVATETLEGAVGHLERFARAYEATYSRFLPDSLISKLNRERILHEPDADCRALLTYGKQLYLRTNTHFNFLTGHILEARGYDQDYSFKPQNPDILTPGNPITDLIITESTIELTHGSVDLGGFGKGYLIDELSNLLQEEYELQYFIINGGGDMYITTNHGEPVTVYLEHPTKPKTMVQETTLSNQGFAASSPFKRQWEADTQSYTHIVSEIAAAPVASFIKAASARDADAYATTALLAPETEFTQLIVSEGMQAARFDPATDKLWYTKDFGPKLTST